MTKAAARLDSIVCGGLAQSWRAIVPRNLRVFAKPQTIIGRSKELEDLGEFLDGIEAGPIALVLDGELGIGKTMLWKPTYSAALAEYQRV